MPIRNRIAELHDQITGWRRDLHQHPELMYDLPRTSAFVAEKLRAFGCDEVVTGIGRSGVVGILKGRSDSRGNVIGLRADMDALPMTEVTGLPHASRTPGMMHACGHDGHTAMLLGAAQYLSETRNFDGTVALIFQPAEEGGAGMLAMIDDGLIDRFGIREAYGMHNAPGLPVGHFEIRPGPLYAAADAFEITVTGKGAHAAEPHNSIDPTVASAQLVLSFQTIASRSADPMQALVVSVCSFRTLTDTHNVIPQSVTLKGTVRSFDPPTRLLAERRIREICAATGAMYGATVDLDWQPGYPSTVNHADETLHAIAAARRVTDHVDEDCAPIMAAEDFAYIAERIPCAFIGIGNGDGAGVHHPMYDFNDAAIPHGTSYWAGLVEARMPMA